MSAVLDYLPKGNTLSDEEWARRHKFLQWVLGLHIPALFAFGVLRDYSVSDVSETLALPLACLIVGHLLRSRRLAASAITLGLVYCSAALVGFSGGAIEAHFHFFIIIGFIALYQDWVPFLLNILFTVLSHGIGSSFVPDLMFNHASAQQHPWEWSLIHGVAVLAACVGVVLFWKNTEDEQTRSLTLTKQLADAEITRRRFTSDLLVNLARRNQNLLYRQLELLNDLEDKERDPDALADLFRLDHLATRIRRNAESLLVLSGEESPRTWREPVQLVDVVRAAIAEIEDLDRVDDAVDETLAVSGRSVADLTHLFAELLENAVHFSPPGVTVVVRSRPLPSSPGTHLVTIEDWGVGMTPQELAEANEILRAPREVDLSVSQRLGLHVVARLAHRYGITVELTPTPGGGVTAVAMLPPVVFERSAELVGAGAPGAGAAGYAAPGQPQISRPSQAMPPGALPQGFVTPPPGMPASGPANGAPVNGAPVKGTPLNGKPNGPAAQAGTLTPPAPVRPPAPPRTRPTPPLPPEEQEGGLPRRGPGDALARARGNRTDERPQPPLPAGPDALVERPETPAAGSTPPVGHPSGPVPAVGQQSGPTPAAPPRPTTATPSGQAPGLGAPSGQTPATGGQTPGLGAPSGQTAATGAPSGQTPAVGTPSRQTPGLGTSTGQTPGLGTPTGQTPGLGIPSGQTPALGAPSGQAPAVGPQVAGGPGPQGPGRGPVPPASDLRMPGLPAHPGNGRSPLPNRDDSPRVVPGFRGTSPGGDGAAQPGYRSAPFGAAADDGWSDWWTRTPAAAQPDQPQPPQDPEHPRPEPNGKVPEDPPSLPEPRPPADDGPQLRRRVPQANLAAGLRRGDSEQPGAGSAETPVVRDPMAARNALSRFQAAQRAARDTVDDTGQDGGAER